jgi:hypothetical protein
MVIGPIHNNGVGVQSVKKSSNKILYHRVRTSHKPGCFNTVLHQIMKVQLPYNYKATFNI